MGTFTSGLAKSFAGMFGAYQGINVARKALTSSISMEREMYNVQRATDATGAALKKNEDFILDLARATGKTKEELAQMFAAGGFAGRPAHELQRYTEYAAKATVAWGTNAQETGQALAEIGNIYDANQRRIEQIGDTINSVADASASSEKDLIEIVRRVGGAGKSIGISAENMIAFGAALKEVGVGTEVASTGLNALITKISTPDDGVDDALASAGLNAKKFRKAVEKDATGAIMILLKALNKVQGTKRMSILKDMFGMEYADDMSRLVMALPRVTKMLDLANDKKKAWGSVRAGFADALEKDFNRIDRATQSIDVLYKRMGDGLKEVAGGFAETINKAVDASEKARSRVGRLDEIDQEADERAGKPKSTSTPSEDPLSWDVMNKRARESILDPRTDDSSLHGLALYGGTDEIKAAAEAEYRRRRLAAASKEGMQKEAGLFGHASSLMGKSLLAGPDSIHADRIDTSLSEWERLRQARMLREFSDMYRIPKAQSDASKAGASLTSIDRLASFGSFPISLGKGKAAKTFDAPKLDLESAGTTAGSQFITALGAEIDRGMPEIAGKISRLKAMMSFSVSPSVNMNFGTSVSGLNTGKQGAE